MMNIEVDPIFSSLDPVGIWVMSGQKLRYQVKS